MNNFGNEILYYLTKLVFIIVHSYIAGFLSLSIGAYLMWKIVYNQFNSIEGNSSSYMRSKRFICGLYLFALGIVIIVFKLKGDL